MAAKSDIRMDSYNGLLVIIPTRNRSELAISAINSVLAQPYTDSVNVLVSDNSTETSESEKLIDFCRKYDDSRLRYIKPPESMAMARHWEWAMNEALHLYNSNHFLFLTDRMVFKNGEIKTINDIAQSYPDKIISYNIDRVNDFVEPITLERLSWTGKLFEINSSHLLKLSSQSIFHHCLPRMLNCVVPRFIVAEIINRFGNVCMSTAPDFCFCYRSLDITSSIYYYDKSILIEHAVTRSNGANFTRGTTSKDSTDFLSNLGSQSRLNFLAPLPEIITVGNSIIHEYCFVKQESKSEKFLDVDMTKYMDYLASETSSIMDDDLKKEILRTLTSQGWKRYTKYYLYHSFKKIIKKFFHSNFSKFGSVDEAIEYANKYPLQEKKNNVYLKFLLNPKEIV